MADQTSIWKKEIHLRRRRPPAKPESASIWKKEIHLRRRPPEPQASVQEAGSTSIWKKEIRLRPRRGEQPVTVPESIADASSVERYLAAARQLTAPAEMPTVEPETGPEPEPAGDPEMRFGPLPVPDDPPVTELWSAPEAELEPEVDADVAAAFEPATEPVPAPGEELLAVDPDPATDPATVEPAPPESDWSTPRHESWTTPPAPVDQQPELWSSPAPDGEEPAAEEAPASWQKPSVEPEPASESWSSPWSGAAPEQPSETDAVEPLPGVESSISPEAQPAGDPEMRFGPVPMPEDPPAADLWSAPEAEPEPSAEPEPVAELEFGAEPEPATEPEQPAGEELLAAEPEIAADAESELPPEPEPQPQPEEAADPAPAEPAPAAPKKPVLRRELRLPSRRRPAKSKNGSLAEVVGLRIGSSQLAAALVRNGQHAPELVQLVRTPLERGIVVGGEVREPEALALALKTFFAKHKLPRRAVRLGVASNRIGIRVLEVPAVEEPKLLENAIRFRAQELLSIPLSEAIIDHVVLGEGAGDEGPTSRILIAFAHRELIDRYVEACKKARLKLVGIDFDAFALLRAVSEPAGDAEPDRATVAVAIGHERTIFAVAEGGVCDFTRVLEWGGTSLNVALARTLNLTPSQAEPIKHGLSLDGEATAGELSPVQLEAARAAMRNEIQVLARELLASLQFYQSRPESLDIGEVLLTGGGAQLAGTDSELERLLGVPVRIADPLRRVELGKKLKVPAETGSVSIAVGLGIEA